MNFDTDLVTGDDAANGGRHPPIRQATPAAPTGAKRRTTAAAAGELIDGPAPEKVDRSDDALLAHLDELFSGLLDTARAQPQPSTGAEPAAPLSPVEQMHAMQRAERAGDEQALAAFKAMRQAPASRALALRPSPAPTGKRVPRRGLGPRLFIGFDCEWNFKSKGRNRIISAQFYVFGPTGRTCAKLFDLAGDHDQDLRLRLVDALDVVLDEAEQERVFEEWPHEVVLSGFFTRADITAFTDFKEFRHQLNGVNGTFATVMKPADLTLPMSAERVARLKSRYRLVVNDGFDPRELKVRLIDASRLAPPGTALEKLGAWLKEPKVELPAGYSKSDMLTFMRKEPVKFREYALHDARLAALYVLWVLWFSDRHLGLKGLSTTMSGLAVRVGELCMRKDGVHPDVAMNFEIHTQSGWDTFNGRPTTRTERVPHRIRGWLETFLADTYLGGRNECFVFGPTERGRLYDPDLAGAYVTGLAYVMTLDYSRAVTSRSVSDFIGHVAGFAEVSFQFPLGTKYPCLPVQVGIRGLWYPLGGISLCTAPEIELAVAMGAQVEVTFGYVIPWKNRDAVFAESAPRLARWQAQMAKKRPGIPVLEGVDDVLVVPDEMQFPPDPRGDEGYRPMEGFAAFIRHQRLKYQRKSLPFEFIKGVGNGLYGKTGQGYKSKRSFDPKTMGSKPIGASRVSEAAVAAMVCGFVRATASEILWKLPADATAVSVTTDGMLVSVPAGELDLTGEMCRRYQALVERIAPGTSMLELKHQVMQVFAARTRGQFTSEADGKHAVVIAKAGHKVVLEGDEARRQWQMTPQGQADFMVRLALNRYPGQKLPQEAFLSMRDQLNSDWDLQMQAREIKVALEYDFKRKPVNPRMVVVEGYETEHLAFDTVPWPNVDEGALVRTIFDQWRLKNCLKTMADWESWQAFMTHHLGNWRRRNAAPSTPQAPEAPAPTAIGSAPRQLAGAGGVKTRGGTGMMYARGNGGYLRLTIRTFLAAYVQRQWGLAEVDLSQAQLAEWLTAQGYEVKLHDVKNAGRSQLNEQVVAPSAEVMAFLAVVQGRFQGLEVARFVAKI